MGSSARQRTAKRFQTALQQRLDAVSDPNEAQQAYDDVIEGLVSIAIDETELDRIARNIATNLDAIDFPQLNAIATTMRVSAPVHWIVKMILPTLSFRLPKGVRGDRREHDTHRSASPLRYPVSSSTADRTATPTTAPLKDEYQHQLRVRNPGRTASDHTHRCFLRCRI